MNRLLTTTAIALLLSVGPALAADDATDQQSGAMPEASQSAETPSLPSESNISPDAAEPSMPQAANEASEGTQGQLPTQPGVSPDVAKEATQPDSGSPDTSGGAKERSSAPPSSGAASAGTGDGASDSMPSQETSKE